VRALLSLFRDRLVEGEVYRMSFFSVLPNVGPLLCTSHPFKLLFHSRTLVCPADAFSIPFYGLSLMSGIDISCVEGERPCLVGKHFSLSIEHGL
jgi:hypothetical protein